MSEFEKALELEMKNYHLTQSSVDMVIAHHFAEWARKWCKAGELSLANQLGASNKREAKLREALKEISLTVDESLLLDENLADDWDVLRDAVVKAQNVLTKTEGEC